jgi:hypothetical protein
MVMAHHARLPALSRSGRTSLPLLLSALSICALAGLASWQLWIRFANRSPWENTVLPDKQGPAQVEPSRPDSPAPDDSSDDGAFLRDNFEEKIATAATLVGLGAQGAEAAPGELAVMRVGEKRRLWILGAPESAPMLTPELLENVLDSQPVASGLTNHEANDREFKVYMEALAKASYTPPPAFANSARHDVNYAQLMSDPKDYRGDVIHVEGRLKLLRRFNPPAAVAEIMSDFYEGWIFPKEERGTSPVCVIFSELPKGLSPAEKMEVPVAFEGYFFKRYRYKAGDSGHNRAREAPLLIGRTIILAGPPVVASDDSDVWWTSPMLILLFGLTFATVGFAAALTWWFRRGDQRVRSRVAEAMPVAFSDTFEPSDAPPASHGPNDGITPAPGPGAADPTPNPAHPLSTPRFTLDRGNSSKL